MRLGDFYNEVCRRVDTELTAINAAETKRVLRIAGDLLGEGLRDGWALGLIYQWTKPAVSGRRVPIKKRVKKVK
jgi:hypothetical protein